LKRFAAALESGAVDVAALFIDTGYWRDLVAFT